MFSHTKKLILFKDATFNDHNNITDDRISLNKIFQNAKQFATSNPGKKFYGYSAVLQC